MQRASESILEVLMRCPVDNETLVMTERNGVEIDYCPKCRGVWLDRGELDKIVERMAGPNVAPPAPPAPPSAPVYQQPPQDPYAPQRREERRDDRGRRDYDDDDYDRHGRPYKKRKESWLGDIFDF
jgi:Zn-finger nucleic acid-binding protein